MHECETLCNRLEPAKFNSLWSKRLTNFMIVENASFLSINIFCMQGHPQLSLIRNLARHPLDSHFTGTFELQHSKTFSCTFYLYLLDQQRKMRYGAHIRELLSIYIFICVSHYIWTHGDLINNTSLICFYSIRMHIWEF